MAKLGTAVPILMYHSVTADPPPGLRPWHISPELFDSHCAYFVDEGYTTLAVSDFADRISRPDPQLPDRPLLLTFDDGFEDFFTTALPILSRHGLTATAYVTTGFVGATSRWLEGAQDHPMMSWQQVDEVAGAGVEVGSHTVSHPHLARLGPERLTAEVVESKQTLEQRLGRRVESLAYPHGSFNAVVRQATLVAGYSSACAVKNAMSAVGDDRFGLARVIVPPTATTREIGRLSAGHGLPVGRARAKTRVAGVVRRVVRRARDVTRGR